MNTVVVVGGGSGWRGGDIKIWNYLRPDDKWTLGELNAFLVLLGDW